MFDGHQQQHDLMAMRGEPATTTMSQGAYMHQSQDIERPQKARSLEGYPEYYEHQNYDSPNYDHQKQNYEHCFSDDGSSAILPSYY